MEPTDGGLLRDLPGLGGDLEASLKFRDSSRGSAGVVFLDFTLQIWGRGFDRGSTGVALRELKIRR